MSPTETPTQRDLLIETGARLFHELGYGSTGVRQIAVAAGVPTGSFTNHFRSKEGFALAVLDRYAVTLERVMAGTLRDAGLPPTRRIQAYFDAIAVELRLRQWSVGCLVPDLATEAPMLGEALRTAVAAVLDRQTRAFAEVLRELGAPGEAHDRAAVLLAAWQGTLLRMKVERSTAPIDRFRRMLDGLLSAPGPGGGGDGRKINRTTPADAGS